MNPPSTTENTQEQPVKRIKRHIRWDEETIREQDKERGTRQKIDEPDTPFVHGAPKLNLDLEELPNEEDNCMVNIVVNDDNLNSPKSPVSGSEDESDHHNKQTFMNDVLDGLQKKLEEEKEEEDKQKKHNEFLMKRKEHYNEYMRMKEFQKTHPIDEDEEDDKSNE